MAVKYNYLNGLVKKCGTGKRYDLMTGLLDFVCGGADGGGGLNPLIDSYAFSNRDGGKRLDNTIVGQGQSFTGNGGDLDEIEVQLRKVGLPTDFMWMEIYAHTGTFGAGGIPTGTFVTTSTNFLDVELFSTSFANFTFEFDGLPLNTVEGVNYFWVLKYFDGLLNDYIEVGADTSSPAHGGNCVKESPADTWVADNTVDLVFECKTVGGTLGPIIDSYPFFNGGPARGFETHSRLGQSFTGDGQDVGSLIVKMSKIGTPPGTVTANIYAHVGVFGTSSVGSGSSLVVSTSQVANDIESGFVTFVFPSPFTLVNGTKYVWTIDTSVAHSVPNRLAIGNDGSAPTHGGNMTAYDGSWSSFNPGDHTFALRAPVV